MAFAGEPKLDEVQSMLKDLKTQPLPYVDANSP